MYPLPPEAIVEQVAAVVDDIGVDAVKIGMLGNVATIEAVADALDLVGGAPVVLDPVMVAESGATLLDPGTARCIARAAAAARRRAHAEPARGPGARQGGRGGVDPEELARAVHALGPRAVVVTGGHREEATDLFFDGEQLVEIPGERHPDGAAHGSGCTHSSALAAHLALGFAPLEAARRAKAIASEARCRRAARRRRGRRDRSTCSAWRSGRRSAVERGREDPSGARTPNWCGPLA